MQGLLGTVLAQLGFYACAAFIVGATFLGVIPALFIHEELRKVNLGLFFELFTTLKLRRAQSDQLKKPRGVVKAGPAVIDGDKSESAMKM